MLRSYLAAAIHNLFRNRAYAAINICGLALGFTAAILIALYVRDEYSFDEFFPDGARIYRVQSIVNFPGRPSATGSVVASNIAEAMELDFPEVESATRLVAALQVLQHDDVRSQMLVHWADPDFFDLFPMKTTAGTLANSLAAPDSLVITRDVARRFFGKDGVVGQTLELNGQPMRITAVLENLPFNTHFKVEVFASGIASFSALNFLDAMGREPGAIRMDTVHTYIRLKPGIPIGALNKDMVGFADRHVSGEVNGFPLKRAYIFNFVPLTDIHLQPPNSGDMKPSGDVRTLRAMMVIATLILLVAGSNFVRRLIEGASARCSIGKTVWT